MSSDSDHRSSKYHRSSSHRKKHRSSSSSSNELRQRTRQSHYRSRKRHRSSSDSSSDSYSRSNNRHKSSKSSRKDRNGSVSSHHRRRKKSRTPDTPPREIKRDVRSTNDVRNQTFDLSRISSSTDIDNRYFENDDFRIKPFESKKTSKIVYNLETQAITVPNKSKDELNGSTECTLNTKLFEMDEIRWKRWNEFSKEEFQRLTKLHPDFYKKDDSIFK